MKWELKEPGYWVYKKEDGTVVGDLTQSTDYLRVEICHGHGMKDSKVEIFHFWNFIACLYSPVGRWLNNRVFTKAQKWLEDEWKLLEKWNSITAPSPDS